MAPFCGWGATASRLDRVTTRRQFRFYQKLLVLIRSISERWKAEMTLKPSNLVITKYELKSQFRLTQMTLNCELFQSEFPVLSGLFIKNMFPLHICRPNDCTTEIIVLCQIQFYNIFTNVLSNVFKRFH